MSGGSFDYLYSKSLEEAVCSSHFKEMCDYLREHGGDDAAAELQVLLDAIEAFRARWEALAKPLGVLQAAEWVRSCDWGPDDLQDALIEWRKAQAL